MAIPVEGRSRSTSIRKSSNATCAASEPDFPGLSNGYRTFSDSVAYHMAFSASWPARRLHLSHSRLKKLRNDTAEIEAIYQR